MATIEELRAQIQTALANGDDATVVALAKQMDKAKAEGLKAEAEKFAKARETIATAIYKAVKAIPQVGELNLVKAQGFTFKLDTEEVQYKSVALLVAGAKTARTGTGGGAGKTKDEYGVSLGEIFDKFATDEDKTKLEKAASGSAQWQVKVAVKKKAITDGLLKPVK